MLTYEEMVALSDIFSSYENGKWTVNVVALRAELIHNWVFEDYQAQQIIIAMQERGLLPS